MFTTINAVPSTTEFVTCRNCEAKARATVCLGFFFAGFSASAGEEIDHLVYFCPACQSQFQTFAVENAGK